MVCWSLVVDVPEKMKPGCYNSKTGEVLTDRPDLPADGGTEILRWVMQPFTDPDGPVCHNNNIRLAFLTLLLALQGLIMIWFIMICRVAYKVLTGGGAEDVRSSDEGEASEEELEANGALSGRMENGAVSHHEEEVGVESIRFMRKNSPGVGVAVRSKGSRRSGRASGISIPGHGDHKELLGRIGCDKPN